MRKSEISAKEFGLFKAFIYGEVGIDLSESKMPMVSGRLAKRLNFHQLDTYGDYFSIISDPANQNERQVAIDLLTTNETHFFREPRHFDFLRDVILPNRIKGKAFRVWCAASSSGEEPYTIAMVLAEHLKNEPWEVIASDVSTRVLQQAQSGCYAMQRAEEIPRQYLTKYCLKGTGDYVGSLLITKELRQRVKFLSINLTQPFPDIGVFDVIFLRNVMFYFNIETKHKITQQMLPYLRKDSYFIISHSESLNGVTDAYNAVVPSIYRKK
jgi:chemotaxis protein methyltransferase CheR